MKRRDIVALRHGRLPRLARQKLGVLPDLDVCNGSRVIVLLDANVKTNTLVGEAQVALVAEASLPAVRSYISATCRRWKE